MSNTNENATVPVLQIFFELNEAPIYIMVLPAIIDIFIRRFYPTSVAEDDEQQYKQKARKVEGTLHRTTPTNRT